MLNEPQTTKMASSGELKKAFISCSQRTENEKRMR
jgi:hypothetical protein